MPYCNSNNLHAIKPLQIQNMWEKQGHIKVLSRGVESQSIMDFTQL
jgi:hypothetical protein